jgi:O-succinylbenzoic acid--CoA ligase
LIQSKVAGMAAAYNRLPMNDALPTSSLAQTLARRAREIPDAPALFGDASSFTYAQLAAHVAQQAAGLNAQALPADAIVALAAPADELALAALACSWAGKPFLPLAPDTTDARWQQLLARAPERLQRLARLPAPLPQTRAPAIVDPDSAALIIATSGSEGLPKAVVLSHRALAAAACASAAAIPLQAGDVWLDCLPLNHIGGQAILWRCLAAGACVRLHQSFDAARVWQDIAAGKASHVSLVPAMLSRLLGIADTPPPPSLHCALIGGAALSQALWQRARDAGWPLFVSYGMSETAAQITTLLPGEAWHEGLVGQALPGVDIAIADDGRVAIRAPQLLLGYLGEAGSGPVDGWLRTGDLGRIDANGRLTILGRADDVFVSAGINIHPQEIEAQLASCPGVADVAITASRDPVWGDVLAALLVGSAELEAVRAWSAAHLPTAQRPRRFLRVPALPRNAMGKLERRQLPALLEGSQI